MPIENGVMTVTPNDIPTPPGGHFWDAFGNMETEISARWLVRFAQERGTGWSPFTTEEIEAFYVSGGFQDFRFNKLISGGWIIASGNTFQFTEDFIARCHRAGTKV